VLIDDPGRGSRDLSDVVIPERVYAAAKELPLWEAQLLASCDPLHDLGPLELGNGSKHSERIGVLDVVLAVDDDLLAVLEYLLMMVWIVTSRAMRSASRK
jgi:hypothetical protein